jgi:LacI family transcriptional regulator
MTSRSKRLRVLLLLESSSAFARGVLRGVARYSNEKGPWQFLGLPRHAVPNPSVGPDVLDGVISQGVGTETEKWIDVGVPIVNVSNFSSSVRLPSVLNDDAAVGRMVADELMARAFKSFAFVGVGSWGFSVERQAGFCSRLRDRGFEVTTWSYPEQTMWPEQQSQLAAWLASLPPSTAVLACNDVVAWRTLDALRQTRRRVPEDIALIGVDDDQTLCELADPPLSSVRVASETIGYGAARLLARLIAGGKPPKRTVRIAPLGVTTRRSSDVLSISDGDVAAAMNFIASHAGEPLQVTDVCQAVPVSRRLLERRFRAVMGRTMLEEIHRCHLLRARSLLVETNMDLERVARLSGFSNAKQMGALFRSRLRTTPTTVRRAQR